MRSTKLLACLAVLVCVSAAAAQVMMPISPYTNTYTANMTRGFWFTAPVDFTIVGLRVPDESRHGLQNVEVVRMDGNVPPPAYPLNTTAFTSLVRHVGEPSANIIAVNIPVATGEVIGVLGACGDANMLYNSYGDGPFMSEVLGQPVELTRFITQFNIASAPAPSVSSATGSIGRVEVYYVPEPATFGLLSLGALALLRRR